jgi:hypothetical protein
MCSSASHGRNEASRSARNRVDHVLHNTLRGRSRSSQHHRRGRAASNAGTNGFANAREHLKKQTIRFVFLLLFCSHLLQRHSGRDGNDSSIVTRTQGENFAIATHHCAHVSSDTSNGHAATVVRRTLAQSSNVRADLSLRALNAVAQNLNDATRMTTELGNVATVLQPHQLAAKTALCRATCTSNASSESSQASSKRSTATVTAKNQLSTTTQTAQSLSLSTSKLSCSLASLAKLLAKLASASASSTARRSAERTVANSLSQLAGETSKRVAVTTATSASVVSATSVQSAASVVSATSVQSAASVQSASLVDSASTIQSSTSSILSAQHASILSCFSLASAILSSQLSS